MLQHELHQFKIIQNKKGLSLSQSGVLWKAPPIPGYQILDLDESRQLTIMQHELQDQSQSQSGVQQ